MLFIDETLAAKRNGRPISGSELYLKTVRDNLPFRCTPTGVPHVDWLGRLSYPCPELRDHVELDLLQAGSITAAYEEGKRRYGVPPTACSHCPDRCYAETSSLTRNPLPWAKEIARYALQRTAARLPSLS